ncbi:MAG: Stp1/IreP family PP2C-type Ser/Thr phosphatase [Alphaproteobacteria bacterium]
MIIRAFGMSDVGLVRTNNEDSFLIADHNEIISPEDPFSCVETEEANIFLVADGMGGANAGEVASRMAVDLVARSIIDQMKNKRAVGRGRFIKIFRQAVQEANRIIFEEARTNNESRGMGTTLTAAAVCGTAVYFAQAGDSRAYLLRNGTITQMTMDQSLVAQLVAAGSLSPEDAKVHPRRNVILQALGVQRHVDVVMSFAELKQGDEVVLCSDGLWGKVEPEEIAEVVGKYDGPGACRNLIALARERGGDDNITVIVARFDGDGLPPAAKGDAPVYERVKENLGWRLWPRRE